MPPGSKRRLYKRIAEEDSDLFCSDEETPPERPAQKRSRKFSPLMMELMNAKMPRVTRQASKENRFVNDTLLGLYVGSENESEESPDDESDTCTSTPAPPGVKDDDRSPDSPSSLDHGVSHALSIPPAKHQREFYKDQVEFSLYRTLHPTFPGQNVKFDHALQKLDPALQTLSTSYFDSSKWSVEFTATLQSRPGIDVCRTTDAEAAAGKCDACGRKQQRAFVIIFRGSAYDCHTLDDETATTSRCSQGPRSEIASQRHVAPAHRKFYVGADCKDYAEKSHSLCHWRFQLREAVERQLKREGWMTRAARLRWDSWASAEKRRRITDILDAWYAKGFGATLYAGYRRCKNLRK
ncbi:hypothetical protein M7I_6769 [Glarea lozoyensis 74030]|nr:hypothetical protein M7I_6769 [Glarea lozoyensis 74030]